MQKVFEPEVQKFLVRPDSWKYAEREEANAGGDGNAFYWAQLEKLQALGITIDGGNASYIAKGCTPSRAVYTVFWVFSGIKILIRWGFDYFSAVLLIDWIAMVVIKNKVHDERLKHRTEQMFSGLGFPELGEPNKDMFYGKVLVGIRRICRTIKYSSEHRKMLEKAASNQPPIHLSPMETKAFREKVLAKYDTHFRRECNIWQKAWLNKACVVMGEKFGMFREVAVDLLKVVLIAACESKNNDESSSHQQWKYKTQDLLAGMGLSLNEPGTRKFFEELIGEILSEISRFEDANIGVSAR